MKIDFDYTLLKEQDCGFIGLKYRNTMSSLRGMENENKHLHTVTELI